jgi:hypothetical protein
VAVNVGDDIARVLAVETRPIRGYVPVIGQSGTTSLCMYVADAWQRDGKSVVVFTDAPAHWESAEERCSSRWAQLLGARTLTFSNRGGLRDWCGGEVMLDVVDDWVTVIETPSHESIDGLIKQCSALVDLIVEERVYPAQPIPSTERSRATHLVTAYRPSDLVAMPGRVIVLHDPLYLSDPVEHRRPLPKGWVMFGSAGECFRLCRFEAE